MKFLRTLAAAAALVSTVNSLPAVTRQGRYLYSNGSRFYIKGIAYQQQGTVTSNDPTGFPEPTDYVDPLADAAGCNRDLPYLKQLGVNAIRVYSVNSGLNHDSCMSALSAAGIYVILDLALPVNGSIDRVAPAWTTNLLDLYLGTVDAFLKYDNVLAFNIGNEIVTAVTDTPAAPFIKAAARDIKAYLGSKSSSALISFASTDGDDSWLLPLADYLACDQASDSIDLFGLNNYRWCGDATIAVYSTLISDFQNYQIPAYFSEFGCVSSPPRLWTEVQALFGSELAPEWSGGMAFSYFPAVGGYGMVNISSDGSSVTVSDDFTRLQQQYSNVTFINSPASASAGSDTQATCPAESASWLASTTLPPTPVDALCSCAEKTFGCVFDNTASSSASVIIGDLLNYACSTLPSLGGNCNAIGANGTTGVYGAFAECDPTTKLNYALSQYYELSGQQAASCSFSSNATVAASAPSGTAAVAAAQSSCVAAAPTGATVPAAPSSTAPSNQGAGTGVASPGATSSGKSSSGKSGALGLADSRGLTCALLAAVAGLVGGAVLVL